MLDPKMIFVIMLGFLIGEFLLMKYIGYLNKKNWSDKLPHELKGIYPEDAYKKSQQYEKEKYSFGVISSLVSFLLIVGALSLGFFGVLDEYIRQYVSNSLAISLLFFLILAILQFIINTPFDYYATFTIESRYGFNTSSKKLFFIDLIKGMMLTLIVGGILMSAIIFVYNSLGNMFWLIAWAIITLFSVFMMAFYSSVIVPLFNKQTPLEKGELKTAIEQFAKKAGFKLDNIFVIDGSKRSSKANAYFSGFWKKKRIVLYDTLIKDLSVEEIVAVLAHEIGHYKKKHTIQMLIFSIAQTGLLLYVLGISLSIPEISYALGAKVPSFHMGVLAFSLLFTPISIVLGVIGNIFSRKNEYEADAFASQNYSATYLQNALKKLTINNLSNLRPHPAYEFFHYSHPTLLKRIQAMEKFKS